MTDTPARIRALNDAFRTSFTGGKVYTTAGVDQLETTTKVRVLEAVRTFSDFTKDNDPYGEHDFGAVEIEGKSCFWKIDYFSSDDADLGSEDPSDPVKTERVITIMLAEEY